MGQTPTEKGEKADDEHGACASKHAPRHLLHDAIIRDPAPPQSPAPACSRLMPATCWGPNGDQRRMGDLGGGRAIAVGACEVHRQLGSDALSTTLLSTLVSRARAYNRSNPTTASMTVLACRHGLCRPVGVSHSQLVRRTSSL